MGTRGLTSVIYKKETKVAQYNQWDSYPEGQGSTILDFLRDKENVEKLKKKLEVVRFLIPDGVDKEFLEGYEKNAPPYSNSPDNRTKEQRDWFGTFISRDIGAEILENITNSDSEEIVLQNESNFAGDSLFCEWAYVIDFDKNTFEVYTGFNKDSLVEGDRYFNLKKKDGDYEPVKMLKEYSLDDLPTDDEFTNDFKEDED